jgi:cobalt-zinc-cadmium efflux system membrane fusion protein
MYKYIFLIITMGLFACGSNKTSETQEETPTETTVVSLTAAQIKNAGISSTELLNRDISSTIKVNGSIDVPPQNMVSVSIPLGGYLKSTKLLPGIHVTKGEVIAVLEDQQYIQLQQEYLTVQSKLIYAEAEYQRQLELNQSKAASDKVLQQARLEFQTLKIESQSLSEKLKLININPKTLTENNISKSVNIYAPINGFVSAVNVNIGKYVNPTDILFELVNPLDIHLKLNVFEKDLSKLFIGQKLMAYNNHEPERKHPCEIILISQDLSKERTAEVHCHFKDYDKTLLPGMYMNADIEVKSKNVACIENDAIIHFNGGEYLFTANADNTFTMIHLEIGISDEGYSEIINAADFKNKKVVTKGAYSLLMALKNKEE